MTQRLPAVDPTAAGMRVVKALRQAESWFGSAGGVVHTMANSPAALIGYLALDVALSGATLDERLRLQIALAVAEVNDCRTCVDDSIAAGKRIGLDETAILAARRGSSSDRKTETALQFVRKVAEYRGALTDEEFERMRRFGYTNEETAEIIANVVLCIYANYFDIIARPC